MNEIRFNIIVAATENLGIGMKGKLPWSLRKEMSYFSRMTTLVSSLDKMNAVIMGRKTWESIPEIFRPLKKRINIVLTQADKKDFPQEVEVCDSFTEAMKFVYSPPNNDVLENVWIIGGSSVYEAALKHNCCQRLYITWIKKDFECDVFFPEIPANYVEVSDKNVPWELQEENGVQYEYKVYEQKED